MTAASDGDSDPTECVKGLPVSDNVDLIRDEIIRFVVEDLDWEGDRGDLTGPGAAELTSILDSSDLLELAGFLEDRYNIDVDDGEIVPANFESVKALSEFVHSKLAA